MAGNLFIRTNRLHAKEIWYRQEIRTISLLEEEVEIMTNGPEATMMPSTMLVLRLALELHNGEKVSLGELSYPLTDYRPKARLEWLATVLKHALAAEPAELPAVATVDRSSAIQGSDGHGKETHIAPS